MKRYLVITVLLCGIFTACKKSSSPTTSCTLSDTSIVGKYKITAIKFAPASSPGTPIDGMQFVSACDQDNIYELKAGGVATITDTGTPDQCSPPDDATGTWSLTGSTLTSSQQSLSGTISNFSCTGGFTLTSTTTVPIIGAGTSTITLVRQ